MSKTTAPEPHTGLQGEGGACRHQGRSNALRSLPSSSMSIPIRSHRGRRSSKAGLPMCSVQGAATAASPARRRREVTARQDRRADAGERFFRGRAHQGGIAERKAMIDREHELPITQAGRGSAHQPRQRLLPAAAGAGRRPRDHAASRPAASGVPLRRFADVARPVGRRWVQDRPSACEDADAADGDRGALSPSAHDEAGARPQDLSVPAARHRDHAAEPGVGDGHHLHPDGAWLRLSGGGARLVQPPRAVVARVDHDGGGVLRRDVGGCLGSSRQAGHLQHRPGLAVHRQRPSPACSPRTASRSAWTARAPGATTCSSSGCGAASNTRRFICAPTTASAKPAHRSAAISTSTMQRRPHSSLDGTHTRSSLLQPAAPPLGSLTPAEAPLSDAENLFRQPGPPHSSRLAPTPTGARTITGSADSD